MRSSYSRYTATRLTRPATAPAMVTGNKWGAGIIRVPDLSAADQVLGRPISFRLFFVHGRPYTDPTLDLTVHLWATDPDVTSGDAAAIAWSSTAQCDADLVDDYLGSFRVLFTSGDNASNINPAIAPDGRRIARVNLAKELGEELFPIGRNGGLNGLAAYLVLNANYAAVASETMDVIAVARYDYR